MSEHFDVVVIGAGISGIGAGYHLQANCPDRTFVVLEGRERLGGTWDLFRYPGIRSDSDMYTLGYSFKPWTEPKAIADGPSILRYLEETASEYGVDRHIRYRHRVKTASWSSEDARWTVEAERGADGTAGETVRFTCKFLFMCTGYYRYDEGYTPDFPGMERFAGRIVHPQKWTDDIVHEGKRVVVIGSGATAVTLIPEMAKTAAHVTMLQRSPTYVVARPEEDAMANSLRRWLPAKLAYGITRWKNVMLGMVLFNLSRKRPRMVKRAILDQVRKQLGPDFDVETHFTPKYNPWDQRMCLVPNGDLFTSIGQGRASVVTDQIETFTEKGVLLRSGDELEADLIVTATGLELQLMGGIEVLVDGVPVEPSEKLNYKGMMLQDVPNSASAMGYTNASWTLKCDLTCEYVCRLLNYMRANGYDRCTPRLKDPSVEAEDWIDFSSGYIQRSMHKFPKQGSKRPWRLYQNYLLDMATLGLGAVDDGAMEFEKLPTAASRLAAIGSPQSAEVAAAASE